MILSALTNYYEHLLKEGKVGQDGWSSAKVSYAITLDQEGHVKGIQLLERPVQRGEKEVFAPVDRFVPFQKGRSRQIAPYFMCDNAKYLLGAWIPTGDLVMDEKNQKQAQAYFEASANYHKNILKNCDSPLAKAMIRFFDTWDFEENKEQLNVEWDKVTAASGLLIFRSFETTEEILKDDEIHKTWDESLNQDSVDKMGRCLVTGKNAPIARLHPLLKGVRGAQSSGAALVSFNGNAFESYGKEQGDNAPVSEYAAAAYGKALNFLLKDESHHRVIGDTTMVFWADTEENEDGYARFLLEFSGDLDVSEEHKLLCIMDAIAKGRTCEYDEGELKPDTKFYILGLSPNAARISVRFFYNSTFGNMISNIKAHYDRLTIEKPSYVKKEYPSISDILFETVNKKATNKQVQP
ncbi:MAG: type I-C CRISPR-associated protein Cas8c/Csd1, partial [Lachnospiraceae bacterium]|nr:type I-C CRISPR-associated protein Cas8c/Csd1 [Lachnospiraceae bacterium]